MTDLSNSYNREKGIAGNRTGRQEIGLRGRMKCETKREVKTSVLSSGSQTRDWEEICMGRS